MRLAAWLCVSASTIGICMGQGRLLPPVQFASRSLQTNRTVRIYLPPSYDREPGRRFPVLYLHDGQNVFSAAGSNACFGWGGWDLDVIVDGLCAAGRMQEILMVGIDNTSARYEEYRGPAYRFAQDEMATLKRRPPAAGDDRAFTDYATFLIHELKPQIDRTYRVQRDAAHTGVLGASLGGICSLALAWDHPEVFGLAASLSGAFQIERTNLLRNVLRAYHGSAKPVRLYLDTGTTDFTGDDDGRRNTEAVVAELRRIGWKDGATLMHFLDERPLTGEALAKTGLRQDKWKEAQFSQHNEFYWRQRVWRALVFLFPP